MLSDVVVTGKLGKKMNEYLRELIVDNYNVINGCLERYVIPVADWLKNKQSHFHNLPDNSYVFIRGRIESDKEIGLYIVAETLEIMSRGPLLST